MADIQANIGINLQTQQALAQLKALQKQISVFHTSMAKGGAAAQAATANMQQNLVNSVNATGKFNAQLTTIKTTTESFTNSLEKNKLSMGQYFRYGMGSTKTFGKFFRGEFNTINKVARERVKDLQTQYVKMGRDANGAMKAIAVRPLALDMKNVATRTAIAAQKQQLFNQLLKQGSTNLLNFGKNTQWAGRQLMVGFTIPLAILGTTAGRTFMEMEKQAIAFRKVYGDLFTPDAEREKALKDIESLGKEFTKYGIAVADTIGLAADAAAAGFSGADLQSQTTQATKLSVLGQIETQQALETTIALQNAFKMSNEELAESINFLNAVENQTVVSLDDITTAIPKVAPVIKALGGDVEDLSFFLAAMKEGGVNASEGANALKSGLARIINPTQKATEFMGSLGINIKGIVEQNAGDLMGTMLSLGHALDELDPLNRSRAIEQLFGRFQFARISTLFDNITKEGTQASRVADLATASIEELASLSEGELAVVSESTTAKFQSAFEKLKAELAPVGEEFLKLATPFVEFGTKVLEAFNGMGDGTKRIIMGIITIVGAIGPVALMTFGLLMNGIANIVKTFAVLSNAFSKSRQDTKTLGQSFDYLTQEQIQASSVAASLDQIHSQLKQTFTSEASSVDRLRKAYEKAIIAQKGFRGPIVSGGKTIKPQGFAKGGIIRGPGSGTSDSIPAMVSDGEAIIPAEQTEKYGGFINSIIADNVPGFASGQQAKGQFAHIGSNVRAPAQDMSGLGLNLTNRLKETFETLSRLLPDKLMKLYHSFGVNLTGKFNEQMSKSGAQLSAVFEDFRSTGLAKYEKTLKLAGKTIEEVGPGLQELDTRIQQGLEAAISGGTEFVVDTEADIDRLQQQAEERGEVFNRQLYVSMDSITDIAASGLEIMGDEIRLMIKEMRMQVSEIRFDLTQGEISTLQSDPAGQRILQGMGTRSTSTGERKQRQTFRATSYKAGGLGQTVAFEKAGEQAVTNATRSIARGAAKRAKTASPSKVTEQVGKDTAQGYINGLESGVAGANATVARSGAGFEKFNRGLMSASFAMTSLSSIAMFAGDSTGKFAEFVMKASGAMFALTGVVELATLAIRTETGARLGSAIAGSKVGQLAKTANIGRRATRAAGGGIFKQIGGMFSAIIRSPLAKFAGGLTGVVGVLGLLVGGGIALYNAHKKQKQAIEGLGNIATMSAEKIQNLGDIFGVTTTTGGLSRGFAPSLQGVDAETQAGAEQLVGTEDFQKTFAKDIDAIKNGLAKDVETALQTLGARLEASGFAQGQVQAIVNALVEEAGRTDLNLDFANIGIATEQARKDLISGLSSSRESMQGLPSAQNTTTVSGTAVSAGRGAGGYNPYGTAMGPASPERLQAIDQYASSLFGTFEALGQGVENGLVSVEDFDSAMNSVIEDFDKLEDPDKQQVFDKMLESLPEGSEDFKDLLGEVDDFDAKLGILRAKSTGMLDDDAIAAYAEEIKNAEDQGKSISPIIARMNNLLTEQVAATEAATAAEITKAEVTAGEGEIEERLATAQEQLDVYNALIAQSVPVAEAQAMIADSTIRAALAAVAGTEKFGELIDQYNAMAEVEDQVKKITTSGSSGGASKQTSAIDKLTESLRKVVNANAQVTEGFDASSRSIEAALNAGTSGFSGLSQQLRNIGASEDLIELAVGMPPEEFNKYKNRLFNFDAATGSIVGLKAEAKKLGGALKAIAIGEYLEEQRSFIVNTQNQISAVTKLRSSGLSYAQALKVVENQSVATAIATAATTAELNEILRITEEVAALQERMDREQARSQVSESVRASNKEYNSQAAVLNKLARSQGQYTDSQISAILDDPDLATLFLNPSIDPGALKKALENARRKADLELRIKVATEEGKEGLFEELSAEVSDEFNRQETKLQLEVDIATKADNDIVREAQNQISEIQYQLDDYNAELEQISWLEDDINEKYDQRSEALESIADASGRIAAEQKAQLNIADALAQGDIAAAARAAQELRQQQAESAQRDQKDALEKAREAELATVRGPGGIGREELEKTITELERRAFLIEEESLEPAQERIRLAEYNRDVQISALEVSGKTRSEWEQIASQVDLATQNTDEFALSVERALALFEYFVNDVPLDTLGLFGGQLEALKEMGIDVQEQTEKKAKVIAQSVSSQNDGSDPAIIPQSNGFYSASGDPTELDVFRKYRDEDTDDLTKLYLKQYASQKGFLDKLTKGTLDTSGPLQKIIMPSGSPAGETRSQANRVSTSSGSAPATPPAPGAGVTRAMTKPEMAYVAATTQDAYTKAMMMRSLQQFSSGGKVARYAVGGRVAGYAAGGYASMGSDNIPAMLTPGEFVVRKRAVQNFGMENLEKINSGSYADGSVYNYNLAVNVNSDSDPDKIARAVVTQIKRVDSQRIRNNKL